MRRDIQQLDDIFAASLAAKGVIPGGVGWPNDSDVATRFEVLLGPVDFDRHSAANPVKLLDLGCGPGYSTHFMAETLPCCRAVGLDRSESFLAEARRTETNRVAFFLHDVATVPFPVEPADLLYCRYLLTHLPEPQAVVPRLVVLQVGQQDG